MKVLVINNQARSMAIFWRVLLERMKHANLDTLVAVPAGDAESEARIAATGATILNYPLERKGLNPLADLQTLTSLKNLMAFHQPDIVFASTIKPVIYASLAAKWQKIPGIFATITGLGYVFEKDTLPKKIIYQFGKSLYRQALSNIDGIYFQNRDDAALFSSEKIISPHQRILFAPGTGVDTAYFSPRPFPQGSTAFLLMGRLLEAKGIEEYVAAARILKQKWPQGRFQLLGIPEKGPGSLPLERVLQWQNEGILEYLGQTTDVRPYIANAHVAVLPSWREGRPTALLEAMAMGRPLVATDVPGCREVVENGKNGWLCESRNPQSLASAMEKFLLEPKSIKSMGAASRELALQNFDAIEVSDKIIAQITRIVSEKNRVRQND